ncbi:biliverdin-producing heme oxygenase [Methylosinus sp. H3A]|uniref:biliverdin-producing heme oxygenase n=1 Tax=Methylosinus sp. H3A TaxID=2785786 RepID=UPI0018C2FFF5|nr:biliverdin-producing heme oxygenase [Methylosinus sp. H3A]MBG0811977.1 biliverdin-producing heme oxygenase [Methylosinus sp. H3A]
MTSRVEESISPARAALRSATHAAHQRLHGHPALAALAAGTIAPTQYLQLLARLYGFHLPFERALTEASLRHGVDLRIGARAHLLARDLVDLGAMGEAIAILPMAEAPALRSPGEWLGALYVREGSTLGAMRLAAALDPLLGDGNPRGRRFLSGGDAEGWRQCCAALEAGAARGLLPEIVEGARASFHALERWLADQNFTPTLPITMRGAPGK